MENIRNLNIWKERPEHGPLRDSETRQLAAGGRSVTVYQGDVLLGTGLDELCLSVRSYNCLKRAGCSSIGDVMRLAGEDGQGLMKIRNLGRKSAEEILEKITELQTRLLQQENSDGCKRPKNQTVIRPAKRLWDMQIETLGLSAQAYQNLRDCGIRQVRDLYRNRNAAEPGWYAVRELFAKL